MKSKEKKEEKTFWELFEDEESFSDSFDAELFDQACQDRSIEKGIKASKPGRQGERKKWAAQKDLDLHGLTAYEAENRVESFILSARYERLQVVRIITGKGLHSAGPPVLPDIVEQKMRDLKEKQMIRNYFWEKKSKSYSGALIIML